MEKRIIFLGFNGGNMEETIQERCSAGDVCSYVLAAICMVNGILYAVQLNRFALL